MNCKFCGNFIPEGSDSCSVCGRRDTEDPMGKLLSENQPQNFAPAITSGESSGSEKKKEKKVRTEIITPLIAIALSAVGWLYALSSNVLDALKSFFNDNYNAETGLSDNSSFVEGSGSGFGKNNLVMIGSVVVMAIITIIGIIGIITLLKRLFNRLTAKKDDK